MESKSKIGNEYLINIEKAGFINFNFDKKEFKLIKISNVCGSINSDFIEFTDQEILKKGFLDILEKNLISSKISDIYFRLIPIINDKKIREQTISYLKKKKYEVNQITSLFIDLNNSNQQLRQNLRKSYKSLINKEKKFNQVLFSVDKHFSYKNFQDWINLYNSVLARGNKKLSEDAIKNKENALKNEELFICLAYEENKLLGGMTFNLNKYYISYSSAANNLSVENDKSRSVGHHLMWESIIKLKEMNFNYIDLGSIDEKSMENEKLNNIIKFKKGFGPNELITSHFKKHFND
tara:strand:+ start:319 stop:1200 length:882 start_codon:yes stop_codon:yes gene_type:complete